MIFAKSFCKDKFSGERSLEYWSSVIFPVAKIVLMNYVLVKQGSDVFMTRWSYFFRREYGYITLAAIPM